MKCLRTCCVCKQMKPKEELIRICKPKEGELFVDETKKADGRGAYVCNNENCISKLKKSGGLCRTFKKQIPEKIYEELLIKKEQ